MLRNYNPVMLTDSYKHSHWKQYPPKTSNIYSYFESRSGPPSVFFGLQILLMDHFMPSNKLFGSLVTPSDVFNAKKKVLKHMGLFNEKGWDHVIRKHDGNLPIRIKSVDEGTVVPSSNVLMTVENTCPECYWMTNYWETILSHVWYTTRVATYSREFMQVIYDFAKETSDAPEAGLRFKLHDFGFRGSSCVQQAARGGAAHLINSDGTDTLIALDLIEEVYGEYCAGYSIPASEHSTITTWMEKGERDAFANMLDQYPDGPVACVSDSYDLYRACNQYWGQDLKSRIINRDGFVVVRPDSGDPSSTVLGVLESLGNKFGYSVNSKGFRVLDPHVRVIQGDGVYKEEVRDNIFRVMRAHKWSLDNLAFGSGGALLMKHSRDDASNAFKCSSAIVDGEVRDVFKRPATMSSKNSKRGRLKLCLGPAGEYFTCREGDYRTFDDHLKLRFENGRMLNLNSWTDIKRRAKLAP